MAEEKKTTAAASKKTPAKTNEEKAELEQVESFDYSGLGLTDEDFNEMSGVESIDLSDIKVPYGKIYAKEEKGFQKGDFEFPDGRVIKALSHEETVTKLAILKIQPVRVMFPTPYKAGNTFICRSFDGKVGAKDGKYAGQKCATCEFSQYPEDGGAPPCRAQQLLLMTAENDYGEVDMFYLLVSGVQVKRFREQFLSVEMMKGLRLSNKVLGGKLVSAMNLTLHMNQVETDYGMFPAPEFKIDKKQPLHDPKRISENLDILENYKTFEEEAVESAATFAQTMQGEDDEDVATTAAAGENDQAF